MYLDTKSNLLISKWIDNILGGVPLKTLEDSNSYSSKSCNLFRMIYLYIYIYLLVEVIKKNISIKEVT